MGSTHPILWPLCRHNDLLYGQGTDGHLDFQFFDLALRLNFNGGVHIAQTDGLQDIFPFLNIIKRKTSVRSARCPEILFTQTESDSYQTSSAFRILDLSLYNMTHPLPRKRHETTQSQHRHDQGFAHCFKGIICYTSFVNRTAESGCKYILSICFAQSSFLGILRWATFEIW